MEKGTIHTKRHSGEDPIKTGTCKSDSGLRAFSTNFRPPRGSDKIRALSGPSILPRPEDMLLNDPEVRTIRTQCLIGRICCRTPFAFRLIRRRFIFHMNSYGLKKHSSYVILILQLCRTRCRCPSMAVILLSSLNFCLILAYRSVVFIGNIEIFINCHFEWAFF